MNAHHLAHQEPVYNVSNQISKVAIRQWLKIDLKDDVYSQDVLLVRKSHILRAMLQDTIDGDLAQGHLTPRL